VKKLIVAIGVLCLGLASKVFAIDASTGYFKTNTSPSISDSIGEGTATCIMP